MTRLAEQEDVQELLSATLGREVRAKAGAPSRAANKVVAAVYADDLDAPVAACVVELELAACLAAAMVAIPKGAAIDACAEGNLSGTLADALNEVLNIAAQLFRQKQGSRRVAMSDVFQPGQELPGDLSAALKQPGARLDLEVDISGYSTGVMSLLSLS